PNAIIASSDKANANARPSAYLTARGTFSCLCIGVFSSARRGTGYPRAAAGWKSKNLSWSNPARPLQNLGDKSRGQRLVLLSSSRRGLGRSFARWGRFTLSRYATGHKLDIQTYKGRVIPQNTTLYEQAA